MALGLNKILITSTNSNTPGAYWQLTTLSVPTGGVIIPAGSYIVFPTANVSISAVSAYNATSNAATWTTISASGVGAPFLVSDGVNVAANASTAATLTLATVNGGLSVSGTYNAS
jgi:hypothetical protein